VVALVLLMLIMLQSLFWNASGETLFCEFIALYIYIFFCLWKGK
jgi:hypothetical protein